MGNTSWMRSAATAAWCMALFILQSCGGGGGTPPPQQPAIASIEVTSADSTCITPPATRTYTAVARDAGGNVIAGVTFTWISSATTAATVDGNGVATSVAVGSTQITASAGGVQSTPVTLTVCAIVVGPPPGGVVLSGDVDGATERETPLDTLTDTNYHFEFDDPFTRSVMFHNTFYANAKNGQAVTVRAYYKVEGQSTWVEEDWTGYEWIGFCRDRKQQRLSDLVVVTSASGPAVVAAAPPRLMRNVVGCFKFEGTAKRVTRQASWSSGTIELTASRIDFDYHPGGTLNQYNDVATGRLRVPILAPQFFDVTWRLVEGYSDSGCSYSLDQTRDELTVALGGNGFATIFINNFIDSLPVDVRQELVTLHGATSLAYTANGGSNLFPLQGTVSGPQPDCGPPFSYESGPGLWLLNHDGQSPVPLIDRLDGTLTGTFVLDAGGGDTSTFTWTLTPIREP